LRKISTTTMFLLHCSDDDSLVICNKSNVIFQNEVEKGDVVSFHYREKEYLGTIIECSGKSKQWLRLTQNKQFAVCC